MAKIASRRTRSIARRLRVEMPDAERLVWSRLRAHRLAGLGFRRQVPMFGYVADFLCQAAKLVVELDGGQHTFDAHRARDERRDDVFEANGFKVLRLHNPEVYAHLDDVIETIYRVAMDRVPNHPDHLDNLRAPTLPSPAERERVPVEPCPAMRERVQGTED